MKHSKTILPIFLLFLFFSLIILFFLQTPFTQPLQQITLPIQKWAYQTLAPTPGQVIPHEKLEEENNALRIKLAKTKEVERDNQSLRDQFQVSDPSPKKLLPAMVIGLKNDLVIIDKGVVDKVNAGDIVIVKDNLIGRITKASPRISEVTLLSDPGTSLTATTANTSAIGVIKSQGGDSMYLDSVVLSDKLEKGDIVITKGDVDNNGKGFPPKLVVGKIDSINKKASSLFQQAKVKSLVDISKVRMVFVITGD